MVGKSTISCRINVALNVAVTRHVTLRQVLTQRAKCIYLLSELLKGKGLIKHFSSQAHRIEDQRSEPPLHRQAPTVPDEDFFGLILRLQSNRMDDQRSALPGSQKRYIAK